MDSAAYEYQVTVPLSGELIILESLKKKFLDSAAFGQSFRKLVDDHDKEFNKTHRKAGEDKNDQNSNSTKTGRPEPVRRKLQKDFESVEAFRHDNKEYLG